jgi:flagellar protein FlbD
MIELTKLNNQKMVLNADLVKFVEQSPDTVITLVSGEKMIVRESVEEVVSRILAFRRSILHGMFTEGAPVPPAPPSSIEPADDQWRRSER